MRQPGALKGKIKFDEKPIRRSFAWGAGFGAGFFLCALAVGEIGYMMIKDKQ